MADNDNVVLTLADYPYCFDDIELNFPLTWQETVKTVEDVQQTEAGADIIIVTRYDKLTVNVTARVTSTNLAIFNTYSKKKSFNLYRYDVNTGLYDTRRVRMRNYVRSLKRHSEDLTITMGVWDVSFTLEEI